MGLSDEEVILALAHANNIHPERYTILGDNGLDEESAARIAETTEVI